MNVPVADYILVDTVFGAPVWFHRKFFIRARKPGWRASVQMAILRGADSVYVAATVRLQLPLATLDRD